MSDDLSSLAEPIEVPTPMYEPAHEPFEEDENELRQNAENRSHSPYAASSSASEGAAKKKTEEEDDATRVGGIALILVCLILQAVVFILAVVATPLDVLKSREEFSYIPDSRYRACYSMWGYKRCGAHRNLDAFSVANFHTTESTGVTIPAAGYVCTTYRNILRAASAFSIIGIFFSLLTLVLVVLCMCRLIKGFIPAIFAILSFVFLLICWACIAGAFYKTCVWESETRGLVILTATDKVKAGWRFGAGFGIMVASFGVQVIVAIMLFFV